MSNDERILVQEIFMPALGMASTEVYLAAWIRQPGDTVVDGEAIALVETDKAELTVESPGSGILGSHLFDAEISVPAGATIAFLLQPGEAEPATSPSVGSSPPNEESARSEAAPVPSPNSSQAGAPRQIVTAADRHRDPVTGELEPYLLSPHARTEILASAPSESTPVQSDTTPALADAAGVDLSVTDSLSALRDNDGSGDAKYRSAVSKAVSRSWSEIPHFVVNREIRAEELQVVLRSFRSLSPGVTFTDLLLKTFALSLIERFGSTAINLGLAVATPRGVAIPVLESVATTDLLGIARARRDAVERAVAGRMNPADALVPHSSVSNLGSYGVDSFTGIIPFGQTSLLTVGAAALRPVVENGTLAVGSTLTLTLNVDHRAWDGQHAAGTLSRFAAIAAEPRLLLALNQPNDTPTRKTGQ